MDAAGIDRAAVLGQSMGGGIALSLVLQNPERVEKLLLIDSAGLGREMPFDLRVCTLPLLGWFLTRTSVKRTTDFLRKCYHDPAFVTREMVERVVAFGRLPGAHRAMLAWLRGNADFGGWRKDVIEPVVERLSGIQVPTLVIWGRQDRIIPVEHSKVAERGIPQVSVRVLDPCGHVPQVERADEFVAVVLDFLGGGDE
jgi:4,5:9,10-diseco-3-hydroxy-5,9,17-trioxoandrosta-1(10),2-diene-4-oate hydrolase